MKTFELGDTVRIVSVHNTNRACRLPEDEDCHKLGIEYIVNCLEYVYIDTEQGQQPTNTYMDDTCQYQYLAEDLELVKSGDEEVEEDPVPERETFEQFQKRVTDPRINRAKDHTYCSQLKHEIALLETKLSNLKTEEERRMNNHKYTDTEGFTALELYNGYDITKLSDDDLMQAIRKNKQAIAELSDLRESKKVAIRIKGYEHQIERLKTLLDKDVEDTVEK